MPFIRSLAFKRCAYIVATILLLGEIMPIYSYCAKKKLVYVVIIVLFSCQLSFYIKYIKLNIHSSCNIKLVLDTKYMLFVYLIIL